MRYLCKFQPLSRIFTKLCHRNLRLKKKSIEKTRLKGIRTSNEHKTFVEKEMSRESITDF